MKYIAILGRQPELSVAELEAVYGTQTIQPLNNAACLLTQQPNLDILGGTIKVAKLLTTAQTNQNITEVLSQIAKTHAAEINGKMQLGISVYGKKIRSFEVQKMGLAIKKQLRAHSISVRLIPNKTQELNTAQVIHNKLTGDNGFEYIIVYTKHTVYIGQTTTVQDIDAYTKRDREKPVRDSFVGMLPPKLAQIMLNLAHVTKNSYVLDPFCGTGTVLLEAIARGASIAGSDLSEEMVTASRTNVHWFYTEQNIQSQADIEKLVILGDAQNCIWPNNITTIVCETYLGPPLRHNPTPDDLHRIQTEVLTLHINFLKNLAPQIKSGTELCLAVPMWRIDGKTSQLKLVDYLEELGYNRVSFKHVNTELQYYRPQAHVGRQLLVLKRK